MGRQRLDFGISAMILGLFWLGASIFLHPLPHTISDRAGVPIFRGAEIPAEVAAIFSRACVNCHSEKTQWPWYSQLLPASWIVENDVKTARGRMNLSRWDAIEPIDQRLLLAGIAKVVENHEMPPTRYLALHADGKLSVDEAVQVIEWTRAERRRLRENGKRSQLP